jgi:hypothetical protein
MYVSRWYCSNESHITYAEETVQIISLLLVPLLTRMHYLPTFVLDTYVACFHGNCLTAFCICGGSPFKPSRVTGR